MKNLDRYTLTALWLADFLNDEIRRIILNTSKCTSLIEADTRLDEFVAACKTASHNVLVTNPAAMAKISDDARMFGFAESELSRRLNIKDGDHTDKLTVITWDYTEMQLFMLSSIDPAERKLQGKLLGKLYDKTKIGFRTLVSALISRGCYAEIGGKVHKYEFFAASAGQLRKTRFVLLRDDMYKRHYEALTLGLTPEKINSSGGILASKFLPYLALCMSSSRKEDWFDLDRVVVVPDRSVNLTLTVDTVTTDYDIVRGERNDIQNPISDGIGMYWLHDKNWKPKNKQIMGIEEVVKDLLWDTDVKNNCYTLYVGDLELQVILNALREEKKKLIKEGRFNLDSDWDWQTSAFLQCTLETVEELEKVKETIRSTQVAIDAYKDRFRSRIEKYCKNPETEDQEYPDERPF